MGYQLNIFFLVQTSRVTLHGRRQCFVSSLMTEFLATCRHGNVVVSSSQRIHQQTATNFEHHIISSIATRLDQLVWLDSARFTCVETA